MFAVVMLVGALGYHQIGQGRWALSDCLYMALITLSTVGYGETLADMHTVPGARAWTGVLILLGSGTLLYFASTLTALIVEGDLRGAIRRRRMSRLIDGMHDHIIVCGVGSTGSHVVAELVASHTPLVAVDIDLDRIERVATELGQPQLPHVHGNATEDHVLEAAGIRRARGLIAALHEDRDNLFVTVTARALSDRLRIVAKAVDHDNTKKLARAGADSVVAPAFIGGVRLASEMVRPSVVQFLDAMTRDPQQHRRIEEFPVRGDSPVLGRTLGDVAIRDVVDGLVIAVRYQDGHHEYNPPPSTVLQPGVVLIVLVVTDEIEALRTYLAGG